VGASAPLPSQFEEGRLRKDNPIWFECPVEVHGWCYLAKALIMPAKKAPHVGADSPRHMEPGRRMSILSYSLYDDDGEETFPILASDIDIIQQIKTAYEIDQTAEILLERRVV
jgi:hypothetical protein